MKNSNQLFWYLFLAMLLSFAELRASDKPLWLSNVPPANLKKSFSSYGMHRLCTTKRKRGEKGVTKVIQWVRQGASVQHARYISLSDTADYNTFAFSPHKQQIEAKVINFKGKSFVEYINKEEGYYNVYLVMKKVSGDTLYIDIAKAELLSHSCRNGHKNVRKAVKPKIYPDVIPFEIVRERHLNENFHFFISSGDRFTFKPMFNGKPAQDIPVTLCTEKGWCNKEKTNKTGEVEFQFIQDYFTHWSEINRRKIYYYLIYSELTINKSGNYKGQDYKYVHYTTSLSDGYFPSRTMYTSLVWSLIVFVVSVIVIVAGIAIFRERRKKPYKEYIFYENED